MAAGDVYSGGPTSIGAGAYLTIQPSSTAEASIHNIFAEDAFAVFFYDGTNQILVESFAGADSMRGEQLHVTNARWLRVRNDHASVAKYIGWDGFQTKT